MLIEFKDAHNAMLPYFDRLWGVIDGAWKDWEANISPQVRATASDRSRACLVNDFIRNRGIRLAEEDETINATVKQQMFVLVFNPPSFNGCIGIRLKKFDEKGLSKNNMTTQVQSFRNQDLLPGIDAVYHLEAGYVIDRFGSTLKSIDLVCPSGAGNYWKAEILPTATNQNLENLFPQEKLPEIKEVRVKKRSDKSKSGKQDGEGHAEAN